MIPQSPRKDNLEGGVERVKLKELREACGLTLAQAAHVTKAAVCMWESGDRQPGLASLLALADLYGVSLDALFGRTPPGQDAS